MAKDHKKPDLKKPKFNSYWIYAAIVVVFIGLNLFGGGSWSQPNKTTQGAFETFLRDGDVEKVEIINRKVAKVYLTAEAKTKEKHLKKNRGTGFLANGNEASYQFEFGDLQNFENNLNLIKSNNDIATTVIYETDNNVMSEILISLLPFVVIIGIWIFIMRRMSGGAGGGAGGQLFNIGKSKAKLFDQKTDVKTSFKDVAGLEGAKEEVQEIVDFLKKPEKYTSLGGKNTQRSPISWSSRNW